MFRLFKRFSKSTNPNDTFSIGFERAGSRYLSHLSKHLSKVPLGITLLELAWTAGPVTFIALQSGHILGFGNAAPMQNVIYFMSYTLVAGIIGMLALFVRKILSDTRINNFEQTFVNITDNLFNLILASKDIKLRNYNKKQQQFELLRIFLTKPDVNIHTLYHLLLMATKDSHFSETCFYIALYRKNALFSLEAELIENKRKLINEVLETIATQSSELANDLRVFIFSNNISFTGGISRPIGFLDKVLKAGLHDDVDNMSISDAEHIFTLALELLYGRRFHWYECILRNDQKMILVNKINKLRNEKRRNITKFYSLLHKLSFLNECNANETFYRESMLEKTVEANELIINKTNNLVKELKKFNVEKQTSSHNRVVAQKNLRFLKKIILAYQELSQVCNKILQLNKQIENLKRQMKSSALKKNSNPKRSKLSLVKHEIEFQTKARTKLANTLNGIFEDITILQNVNNKPSFTLSQTSISHIAIEICTSLDELMDLSNVQVQKAIEYTNSLAFKAVEHDWSSNYKIGIAKALVLEANRNDTASLKSVIYVLTKVYQINLDQLTQQYIADTLGVEIEEIDEIINSSEFTMLPNEIDDKLRLSILPMPKEWHSVYQSVFNKIKVLHKE